MEQIKQIHNLVFSGKPATQKPDFLGEDWNNPNHIIWHNSQKKVQVNSDNIDKLFEILLKGYSIKAGIFNLEKSIKQDGLLGIQIIGADFDKTDLSPHDIVAQATALGFKPNFWYYTFSQGIKEKNNFRVIWVLNACITKEEYIFYFKGLLETFPGMDDKTNDGTRVWYGTNNGGELIHTDFVDIAAMPYKEYSPEEKNKIKERNKKLRIASDPLDIGDLDWVYYLKNTGWQLFNGWRTDWYLNRNERSLLWRQLKCLHRGDKPIIEEFFDLANPEIYKEKNSQGFGIDELTKWYNEDQNIDIINLSKQKDVEKGLTVPFKRDGFFEEEAFTVREFFEKILQQPKSVLKTKQIEPNLKQENISETIITQENELVSPPPVNNEEVPVFGYASRRIQARQEFQDAEKDFYDSAAMPFKKHPLGTLYIAVAPSNAGKTTWSIWTALTLAAEGRKVRLILTEDDEQDFTESTRNLPDDSPVWNFFDLKIISSKMKEADFKKYLHESVALGVEYLIFDYFKSTMLEEGIDDYKRDLDRLYTILRDFLNINQRKLTLIGTIQGNAASYYSGDVLNTIQTNPGAASSYIEGGLESYQKAVVGFMLNRVVIGSDAFYTVSVSKAKRRHIQELGKTYKCYIDFYSFKMKYEPINIITSKQQGERHYRVSIGGEKPLTMAEKLRMK